MSAPRPPSRRRRRAGRAILVDSEGRVLMIRGEDPGDTARGGFWFTPGGGVEDTESVEDATRRELSEEIGLVVDDLGPVVMERVSVFSIGGVWYEQSERIHFLEVPPDFVPTRGERDDLELTPITDVRWLSPTELSDLDEPHYPMRLVELVEHVLSNGPPDPPWHELSEQ